jgi:hypothetical protein
MWHVGLISYWTFTDGENITRVAQDYAGQAAITDVGETPANQLIPSENIALVEAIVDAATLALMQADAEIVEIVFEEEIIDEDAQ